LNVQQISITQPTGKNMFRDTNTFFKEVLNFTIAQIDIENYIEQITDKYKTDKLITLRQDLYYFAEDYVNDIYDNHSTEHLLSEIAKELSQDIKLKNNLYALITDAENNNAIIKNADFHFEYFKFKTKDIKTHIIWLLLKPINMLVEYLNELIDKSVISIESTPTHNNIFSNNGFILFDYILNNYVKPKDKRGRFSDIGFYYWKMYNSENQYIHQRPEAFKKWFFNNYDKEDIGQIKTATNLKNTNRDKHYSNSLDWFKSQNK
jgi:hypothetical protein